MTMPERATRPIRVMGVTVLALWLVACDRVAPGKDPEHVTVFAAASLTDVFDAVGTAFHDQHPNVSLQFNYLASSDLAGQIEQRAPADVFASADEINMERVVDAGVATGVPHVFAHNSLEIIVPRGNPAGVQRLEDLADPDLVIALCNDECPAGRYAQAILDGAGVEVKPDSLESEVKGVVTRIAVGEADAGIVYTTDVIAAGAEAQGIPVPQKDNVVATYPIVALDGSSPAAGQFVDFVLSERGQQILGRYGFLPK
jgi:molybdate transport system substrate-binding protein